MYKINYNRTNVKRSIWQNFKRNTGSHVRYACVDEASKNLLSYEKVCWKFSLTINLRAHNKPSTVLSKSEQKRFRYETRLKNKWNISNHPERSFPAHKKRHVLNRKSSSPSSITSDSLLKRTYQTSTPLPQATTNSRLYHISRVQPRPTKYQANSLTFKTSHTVDHLYTAIDTKWHAHRFVWKSAV